MADEKDDLQEEESEEPKRKGGNKKLLIIIVAATIILGAGGFAGYTLLGSKSGGEGEGHEAKEEKVDTNTSVYALDPFGNPLCFVDEKTVFES